MGEIKIPLNSFNMKGFISEIINFLNKEGIGQPGPTCVIPVVEDDGSTPDWGDEESAPKRDLLKELTEDGKPLYFPFSNTNVGDPVACADGNEYIFYDMEDEEDEMVDDEYETSVIRIGSTEDTLSIGYTETTGYLVQVKEGNVTFKLAIHFMGGCMMPPCINAVESTGDFEQAMVDFVNRFRVS